MDLKMKYKQYDTVRLKEPYSELKAGSIGAIVMVYDNPPAYEVEFCDEEGVTIELLALREELLELVELP